MEDIETKRPGRWKRWRARIGIAFLIAVLMLIRVDNFKLTPVEIIASDYLFSIPTWEIQNFPRKWLHGLWELVPGNKPSREERLQIVDEFLQTARKVQKEEDRIEGLLIRRGATQGSGAATKAAAPSRELLDDLIEQHDDLQGRAEEAVEAELSTLLVEMGFSTWFGLIWPPVDIRFEEPPTLLVLSPRDRISLTGSVLLESNIKGVDRDEIERKILEDHDLVAYVDDLAGLATYPAFVSDLYTTRTVMRTVTHEWLHSYFFFKPLGQNYRASDTMFTINETTADIVGRELGDEIFERMGGDLTVSASRYAPAEDRNPQFTEVMRATRKKVDELLAEGLIDEAEEHMREQQWFLRLRGYGLRKLNQAYFAFRGRYAESPASVSPVGDQLKELRSLAPSVGDFIRHMASVGSVAEFEALLERARAGEL
ncbi:MAG: hypothetical protein QGG34_10235 [SAR202 cluster bacterium]|jgi:hypothetical protein|nr:hypothetical protein [SAR202 cluster bacterium]MDP6300229.1 hypothetical protein [SAR202 cluster bacterium]MDP7103309.1 hypothetical protein [SAR202 cluster bacterium]MDP7224775.1 hypothetical protein [SAR202 cluster bacterium]MDP7412753.1 hypothetical protein [SAR202 cluster bacterium]|tara:strand:- start:8889 stop:10169 length:1281 start_codon:yes stop_codon:yes gene_type:complete